MILIMFYKIPDSIIERLQKNFAHYDYTHKTTMLPVLILHHQLNIKIQI